MSIFTHDTFTDTAGVLLENHTGELGATWTKNAAHGTGSAAVTAANRIRGNASNGTYYASGVPSSADYDVEADIFVASVGASAALLGRQDPTADTFYMLILGSGGLNLWTFVAGSLVNSGSHSFTPTVAQTYHLKLSMSGGQINGYLDGTLVVSFTDSNISITGRAGVYFGNPDTDTTSFHLDNFTGTDSSVPATPVAVTDANLFFSPYNWYSDGAGPMLPSGVNTSSTFAQTNTPGAYLKFNWTAVATGGVTLLLDTTPLNGITAGNCPTLAVSIDGQAITTHLLSYATGTTSLALSGDLAAGAHTVEVWFKSVSLTSSSAPGDRWTAPASVVKVTGLQITGAGNTMAAQSVQAKRLIVFGDSIVEGANAVGNADANADNDATQVLGQLLGAGLAAEVGIVAFTAHGWTVGGWGNVPAFYDVGTPANSSFNKYAAGKSRLVAGLFTPAPDYIVVNMGYNDSAVSDGSVTAAVSGWLVAARAAAPNAKIFVVIPFAGIKRGAITAGVAAVGDAGAFLIDLGVAIEPTLLAGGLNTNDAVHPNVRGHASLAAMLVAQLRSHLGGADSFAASSGNFTGGSVQLSTGAFAL